MGTSHNAFQWNMFQNTPECVDIKWNPQIISMPICGLLCPQVFKPMPLYQTYHHLTILCLTLLPLSYPLDLRHYTNGGGAGVNPTKFCSIQLAMC